MNSLWLIINNLLITPQIIGGGIDPGIQGRPRPRRRCCYQSSCRCWCLSWCRRALSHRRTRIVAAATTASSSRARTSLSLLFASARCRRGKLAWPSLLSPSSNCYYLHHQTAHHHYCQHIHCHICPVVLWLVVTADLWCCGLVCLSITASDDLASYVCLLSDYWRAIE